MEMTIKLSDAAAKTIADEAKRLGISPSERAAQFLESYHESETERFGPGVLAAGRKDLTDYLGRIPCISKLWSSGMDYRHWWVTFAVDETSPIARCVMRHLAFHINTESGEMMIPAVLKPTPEEIASTSPQWRIESTQAMFNPSDLVTWLKDNLPARLEDPEEWLKRERGAP